MIIYTLWKWLYLDSNENQMAWKLNWLCAKKLQMVFISSPPSALWRGRSLWFLVYRSSSMFCRAELHFLNTMWLWFQLAEILIMTNLFSSCGTELLWGLFVSIVLAWIWSGSSYLSISHLSAPRLDRGFICYMLVYYAGWVVAVGCSDQTQKPIVNMLKLVI